MGRENMANSTIQNVCLNLFLFFSKCRISPPPIDSWGGKQSNGRLSVISYQLTVISYQFLRDSPLFLCAFVPLCLSSLVPWRFSTSCQLSVTSSFTSPLSSFVPLCLSSFVPWRFSASYQFLRDSPLFLCAFVPLSLCASLLLCLGTLGPVVSYQLPVPSQVPSLPLCLCAFVPLCLSSLVPLCLSSFVPAGPPDRFHPWLP